MRPVLDFVCSRHFSWKKTMFDKKLIFGRLNRRCRCDVCSEDRRVEELFKRKVFWWQQPQHQQQQLLPTAQQQQQQPQRQQNLWVGKEREMNKKVYLTKLFMFWLLSFKDSSICCWNDVGFSPVGSNFLLRFRFRLETSFAKFVLLSQQAHSMS